MAGAMVGGALLGAFLNVVFDKLASPEVVKFIRGEKLGPLLDKLKRTLTVVKVVLNDAEKKQFSDSNVNKWLNELEHVVYMADDLLDEVFTKAAVAAAATQKRKKVRKLLSHFFIAKNRKIATILNEILDKLEHILKLKESLDLKEIAMENSSNRAPSTSVPDRNILYGRDEDKKAIIELLLDGSNNNEGEEVSVIPIVGMGGAGKTTLAQMVYNDDNLNQHFNSDYKAWVCVSEAFDIIKVTKALVEELISEEASKLTNLNSLQEKLVENLKGKKFLIILDDVWIDNYDTWNDLKKPFQYGMRGSKILVTTRSDNVASVVRTVEPYRLNLLSNEACWLVFKNHACLPSGSGKNTTALEKIGMEIVKKCGGLPLAARSLGGLLRRKRDIKDWNDVMNNDIWESESKIISSLRVSYHYLPPYFKRCFVYCSLYPKNHEFEKNDVILLWMAGDLLPPPNQGKTLKEVGDECFDYLVSSSFLQRSSTPGKEKEEMTKRRRFGMHDLMHDLARFIGGEFYFRSYDLGKETKIDSKTRHLSFDKFNRPSSENDGVLSSAKFLRTFLRIGGRNYEFQKDEEVRIVLSNLEYSRVLSFNSCVYLSGLPDSIGRLIHLRYLDLSKTEIKSLPESLYNLYNLQTLKLEGCKSLTMLPSGIQNLVNLHYLGIDGTSIKEMPKGMSKLKELHHLPYFIVGKHEEIKIKELGGLSNLHGSFAIKKLENVENGSEALEARMMDKKHIQHLELEWSPYESCMDFQTELDILCKLEPHQDLESLEINGYRGTRYPDWVGKPCFHNMTKLKLSHCNNCFTLPSLGHLPFLRDLTISGWKTLEKVDASFFNNNNNNDGSTPFPSLESLEFNYMPCWEVWSCCEQPGAFPKLKRLTIEDCQKLKGDLPSDLPALEQLYIEDCQKLTICLPIAPSLQKIMIRMVNTIEDCPSDLPALEHLEIVDCQQLAFSEDCLPASLKTLRIERCRKLEFPQQQQTQELLLESLDIHSSCDSLTSLPLESFPNLKSLSISDCENLESLLVSQSRDVALQKLYIYNCPKLESLPPRMNTLLPELNRLVIRDCPRIKSFPEQGMPPSLTSIWITYCEKLSLASMDMLTDLVIWGPCDGIKSFPNINDGLLLPPSLKELSLNWFSSLETLDCKGLLHLTNLQSLSISYCPELENLAGESLPASLTRLHISGCPLLGEQCSTKRPHIWPKISHIHRIYVDWKVIS